MKNIYSINFRSAEEIIVVSNRYQLNFAAWNIDIIKCN